MAFEEGTIYKNNIRDLIFTWDKKHDSGKQEDFNCLCHFTLRASRTKLKGHCL